MPLPPLGFDLDLLGAFGLRLLAAIGLALPIGWEREVSARSAGLRTFPLVAVASCGYVLIALRIAGGDGEAQSRVLQGLLTGIGFIGGGAIIKDHRSVTGTATAASIWATSGIGAAVGYGELELALLGSASALVLLRVLKLVERRMLRAKDRTDPDAS